ncbi:hypothetical protein [Sarcina ventriculi]|uniref:hypothetical protein n=1 Tax=Sarcina ventriculi TaxID=1267 RepID=UPI001F48E4F6|nr:hypothetical protein [Sarcina ventriculi]
MDPRLYELRKPTIPAIICEVCFCEATEDVKIYHKCGADIIGKLIADGINGSDKASINGNIIGTLKKDDKVKLAVKIGDWWNIYYGEHGGFVSTQYINLILI